jgi:hypothetical protein
MTEVPASVPQRLQTDSHSPHQAADDSPDPQCAKLCLITGPLGAFCPFIFHLGEGKLLP